MKKWIFLIILSSFLLIISSFGLFMAIKANKPIATIKDKETDYSSYELETPTEGSPEDYNVKDNVAYTLYKIKHIDSFKVITTGSSTAAGFVKQEVLNTRTVIGEEAMVTTITAGVINNATERFFIGDNQNVLYRTATSVDKSSLTAVFPTNKAPKDVTNEQYISDYGWYPYQLTGYIISNDTYLKDPTMKKNDDGTYTLSLDLDPDGDKAPFWYRREILINSSSTMVPEFSKIHLNITINSSWLPIKVNYEESYKVERIFVISTVTNVTDTFYYDDISFDEEKYDYYNQYR